MNLLKRLGVAIVAASGLLFVAAVPLQNTTVTVANTTALRALPSTAAYSEQVTRLTDGVAGAPAMNFTAGTAPCAIDDGASCVNSSDGKSWIGSFPASGSDIREWSPDTTGATDSSSVVQFAVNSLTNGGTLYFPPGTYKAHDITGTVGGLHFFGNNATFDCSGMTDHCIQIRPTTVPAPVRLLSGSIDGIRFIHSNTTGHVIDIEQVYNPYIKNIVMADVQGGATAIRLYGVQNPDLRNIDGGGIAAVINGMNGTFIEFAGDLTGKASTGGACTLGDCSTRSDLLVINNVRGVGANASAVALFWHDQAFTVQANDFQFENGLEGIKVRCAAGQPNIGYCPAVFLGKGVNLEFGTNPVDLQDFTDFRCEACYFAGQNATSAVNHDISDTLVNYTQGGGAGGGFNLTDATIWNSGGSCVFLGVSDTKIAGSRINICNGSNIGAAGVEYSAGSAHEIGDTHFCTILGSNPVTMDGVLVDSGATNANVHDSKFFGCSARIADNSAIPFSVLDRNNQGPGGAPTIAAGTCGTSPSITGTDESFQVVIGTATPSSCQVNFGTPQISAPNCSFSIAPGTAGPGSVSSSTTAATFSGTSMSGRFQALCRAN